MGHFTQKLVVELTDEPLYPFRVWQGFEFHLDEKNSGHFIRVQARFLFNGTSIPRGLRWLISPSDPELLQCAAGHDHGFEYGTLIMRVNGREKVVAATRQEMNRLMAQMMKARKVRLWKRVMINTGLKIGSGPTWRKLRDQDWRRELGNQGPSDNQDKLVARPGSLTA